MSPTPDLSVREYAPADRSFLGWTLRGSARRALQYDPLRADRTLDQRVDEAAQAIEARRQDGWIVLVAMFRGERCGLLVAAPEGRVNNHDIGVPGLAVSRSGARVFVDPWYSEVGIAPALDEAADLARQAARARHGAPRGGASA